VANVGYAQVSTQDQNLSLQLDTLAAAGCGKVFENYASGVQANRTRCIERKESVQNL